MDRTTAYQLLCEYVTDRGLRNHCLAVECAMRAYARKLNQDEEFWGIAGLLHDFDYERWPTPPDHPVKGSEILRAQGASETLVECILSHADYMTAQYPRVSLAAKALYACDELAGFIVACARLRPTGLGDLTASNVRKKMKVKSFARGVNRDDIVRGAADFQVDLDEHIQFVIDALKPISLDLGLTSLPGDSSVSSPQSEDNLDPQG